MRTISLICLVGCILQPFSYIGAYEEVDVYKLSLEEMLDVDVISTSRREEKQHLAPGVLTVVSAQEIAQYGARHLRDVLDRLVGVQVLGSHQDFHSKTSLRAANSSHHEGAVLILLNGRPLRQPTDGGLNSDLYVGFPLNSIDRIEVIRGPGSVIYGTNAMAGVANIITKDAGHAVNETTVDIGAGSFGTTQVEINSLSGGDDYSLNLALHHISSDGDPVGGVTDEDGNVDTYETGIGSDNLFVNGRYKNFTVNGLVMVNNQDSASSAFQLPSNPIDLERYFMDMGYLYEISTDVDISFNFAYSKDTAQWQINEALGDNDSEGRQQMYESIVRAAIGEHANLLLGASHVRNKSGFDRGLPKAVKNSNTSAYAQFDYMITGAQKLIAGVQWNNPDKTAPDLSPRVGFIQGFGEQWWLKLLYSEAYRSPTLVETEIDAPQLKGVPSLKPETIATYDAQLMYKTATRYLALALYHSKLENLIVRVPGTPTTHDNEGFVKFRGVELEGKAELSRSFGITGNISYQENKTNDGVKNGTFAPQFMAKLGASYDGNKGLTAAVFNSYIGESTDLSKTNVAPAINPAAKAYNLLTANVSIDTGKMWSLGKPKKSYISLYLDNILDEDIFAPDLNFANKNNTIPHHWGVGGYLTYSYRLQ